MADLTRAMPGKYEALAVYNAERARGIVHTPQWDATMAALQAEFNQRQLLSDEDQIRDAMAEAHNHPGRTITR